MRGSYVDGVGDSGRGGGMLAHGIAAASESAAVVDEPVEGGVGQGRVAEIAMPLLDRQQAGDQCRFLRAAVIKDLGLIPLGGVGLRREANTCRTRSGCRSVEMAEAIVWGMAHRPSSSTGRGGWTQRTVESA